MCSYSILEVPQNGETQQYDASASCTTGVFRVLHWCQEFKTHTEALFANIHFFFNKIFRHILQESFLCYLAINSTKSHLLHNGYKFHPLSLNFHPDIVQSGKLELGNCCGPLPHSDFCLHLLLYCTDDGAIAIRLWLGSSGCGACCYQDPALHCSSSSSKFTATNHPPPEVSPL